MKKRIGIIGASGYTGFELIKLLAPSEKVDLLVLNSRAWAGKGIPELYPEYDSDLCFTGYSLDEINENHLDLIFLAREAGYAAQSIGKLNCKIIDMSRDLRFKNGSIYGLPEFFRDAIRKADVVANPGCYATACLLATFPLIQESIVKRIIFDCISGYSGAGRTPSYKNRLDNLNDNIIIYDIIDHPHRAEIQNCFKIKFNKDIEISFTPHVIATFRGIMCTAHCLLNKKIAVSEIIQLFHNYYHEEPFIKLISDRMPELRDTRHSNLCAIGGFQIDSSNQLVMVATIDNLLKGASGQAVQNLNLMLGFEETYSLT